MLKKELCKKCWDNLSFLSWAEYDDRNWTEFDERCWEDGEVYCPLKYIEEAENRIRDINKEPPKNCPFFLEQLKEC